MRSLGWLYRDAEPQDMLGLTMTSVTGGVGDEKMEFTASDGRKFVFYHEQDCCESVNIADVTGELADLVGEPILESEEVSSDDAEPPEHDFVESFTWTFYKFGTRKGAVTVRWLGESNGYYSEGVSMIVKGAK